MGIKYMIKIPFQVCGEEGAMGVSVKAVKLFCLILLTMDICHYTSVKTTECRKNEL